MDDINEMGMRSRIQAKLYRLDFCSSADDPYVPIAHGALALGFVEVYLTGEDTEALGLSIFP